MQRSSTESQNEARALFMARHGLIHASWHPDTGELIAANRPQMPLPRPADAPPSKGVAAKVAENFAQRLKRDHDVRFAATHYKPRLDVPQVQDDVPRAVRTREASDGRPSKKQRHR